MRYRLKATAQWFATALIMMLSALLWADDAPKEVHIDLSIEDINDWAVEDETLWLHLTGPAQARVNTQLATEPADTRFSVHFEGRELMEAHWYAEEDISVIRTPVNDATVQLLQQAQPRSRHLPLMRITATSGIHRAPSSLC